MEAKLYFSLAGKLQTTAHQLLMKFYGQQLKCCVFGNIIDIEALNKLLWMTPKKSFLAHSIVDENDNSLQPILLVPTDKSVDSKILFSKNIYIVSNKDSITLPNSPLNNTTILYTDINEPYELHKSTLFQWSNNGNKIIQSIQSKSWSQFEIPSWLS